MAKKYIVSLTDAERTHLETLTKTGTRTARMITRAHILLHADVGMQDVAIAVALRVGTATVKRVRKRCRVCLAHGGGAGHLCPTR